MKKKLIGMVVLTFCGTALAQGEVLSGMRAALFPAVTVQSGVEEAFKVKLDCKPVIINQARNDGEAYRAIRARQEVKGWKTTSMQTVFGGSAMVFIKPNSRRDMAIGSIGSASTYALLVCKSNRSMGQK